MRDSIALIPDHCFFLFTLQLYKPISILHDGMLRGDRPQNGRKSPSYFIARRANAAHLFLVLLGYSCCL